MLAKLKGPVQVFRFQVGPMKGSEDHAHEKPGNMLIDVNRHFIWIHERNDDHFVGKVKT
jgi:hypothetical protein